MYALGKRSLSELVGVHPELSYAVTEAIKLTKQDFTVFDGVRTLAEQKRMVERGVSKTMNSYHLWGLAVDLVPWVTGKASWDEVFFPEITKSMKKVIKTHGLNIEWGFDLWAFDQPHYQLTGYKDKYDIRSLNVRL